MIDHSSSDVQSFQSGGNLIIRTDRDGQWIEGTSIDVTEVR